MTEDRDNLPELPTCWVWAKTGDICEGIVPGRTKPMNFNGTIPWITLPDVTGLYISKSQNNLAVTIEDAEEVGMRVMHKGTVLMSCVGQFEIICIAKDDLVPNQQFHGFLCLDKIFPEYIAYSLMTQVDQMEQLSSATTIAYINKTKCNSIQIPLAPLNEQRRIVAKIEALKARSQRVKEELEAIAPLLDQFRQSVLAAAFRGDLTADWREKNPDSTWESTTLEKVIKDKPRNGYSPKAVDYPTQVKSLTLTATTSGKFKPEFFKYIDEYIEPNSYLWLQPGDILIQRSNTLDYVGSCAIYNASFGEFIYPDLMMKIQVLEEQANTKFIYYALSHAKLRGHYKENATGTAGNMPKINQKIVMNTPINLPPIEEQQVIVYRLEALLKIADKVEQQYKEAKAYLDQLDRSILAKAFRGELVPQDPNDEPASVLLERIRAEREKLDTKKKAKGKTEKKSRKAKPEPAEPEQLSLPGFE